MAKINFRSRCGGIFFGVFGIVNNTKLKDSEFLQFYQILFPQCLAILNMMFFIYLLGEEDGLLEIFSSMRQYVTLFSVIGIILNGFKIPTDVLLICGIIKVCKHIETISSVGLVGFHCMLLFAHKIGAIQKA
jgi:hypothetical protein